MERAYLTGSLYAFVLVGGLSVLMIRRLRESGSDWCRWCWACCGPSG